MFNICARLSDMKLINQIYRLPPYSDYNHGLFFENKLMKKKLRN